MRLRQRSGVKRPVNRRDERAARGHRWQRGRNEPRLARHERGAAGGVDHDRVDALLKQLWALDTQPNINEILALTRV